MAPLTLTNKMNYYALNVESSYRLTKDEISRQRGYSKVQLDASKNKSVGNKDDQLKYGGHCENHNILKDPIIVKTKRWGI